MIGRRRTSPLLAACMALAGAAPVLGAPGTCPEFSPVSWWGDLSHDAVVRRVDDVHAGDWDAYLEKWEGQLATLRAAHANRQEVFIAGKGVRLRDAALKAYLAKVEHRLEVTRCLARRQDGD